MRREARNQEEGWRLRDLLRGRSEKPRLTVGLITLALVALAGSAAAQDVSAPLDDLLRTGLRPGDGVYVTDAHGERTEGRVSEVSATGLTITDGNDEWSWTDTDIVRIEAGMG